MARKSFYLKKLGQRGKIAIWQVDGQKIRSELNEEFTNFGHHFQLNCIPEYEFWIDKEAVPNERRFFIDHLLTEWQLRKNGYSQVEAADLADTKERSERAKAEDFRPLLDRKGYLDSSKLHLQLLKKTPDGLAVWLVDGRLVRSFFDVEFTEGGHDLVYDYIPKNEVWLDNDVVASERDFVLLHELYERELMKRGLTYEAAHRQASKREWQARHEKES